MSAAPLKQPCPAYPATSFKTNIPHSNECGPIEALNF